MSKPTFRLLKAPALCSRLSDRKTCMQPTKVGVRALSARTMKTTYRIDS